MCVLYHKAATVFPIGVRSVSGYLMASPEKVLAAFNARIDSIDFENARMDVEPYVMDKAELEIWCADFFRQMVRKIEFA